MMATTAPPTPARTLVAALAFTLLAGCNRNEGAAEEAAPAAEVTVGIGSASVQAFREIVTAIGVVQPRAGHVSALSAPAPARVARVLVAVGDRVASGAALVELEQAPFEADVRRAAAQLAAAEKAHERAVRLSQEGIVSRREQEQASAELEQARAAMVVARRAAELSVLRAPFPGVVTRMSALLGAAVDANQVLVEVADPSALDIVLQVTPGDAARLRPGASIRLAAGETARGEPLGSAAIAEVAGAVDSSSRAVAVRARATGLTRSVRIGETVYGEITIATRARAVTVPAEALVPEGDGFRVFVVDSASVAHATNVTVGARVDSLVEIVDGLKGGERIVTYGAYGVSDSARVVARGATPPPRSKQ